MYRFLLFCLISIIGYSQKNIDVVFNSKGIIYYEGRYGLDSLNVVKTNVKTNYGKFTLQIIDQNKNNSFVDNKYRVGEIENNYDALHISKYKSKFIQTTYYSSPLEKSNKFIFNGKVFELYGIEEKDQFIHAKIRKVKNKSNYKDLIEYFTPTFSDKLNKTCVYDLSNNKKVKLNKKLLKKKTFFMPIYANTLINSPNFYNIGQAEKASLKNINIIYIIVFSSKDKIVNFKKLMTLKNKVYYLKIDDYEKFCKLGFGEIHMGILFDKKGEVIDDKIFPFNLHKYDN